MLSENEKRKYHRQIMIDEIGIEGQAKLKSACVMIAGAGGLGSPTALFLAAAGLGRIRVVDNDRVEMSNLNRQILHGQADIGRRKCDSARTTLTRMNPDVAVEGLFETLSKDNVRRLAEDCHLIIDAMDNLPTRYLLNKAALELNIPLIHGAVRGFEGRVTTIIPGETACLGCVSRGAPPDEMFPVIGVAPAVIGSIQAAEAVKYITGAGELLTNRLLTYDGLKSTFTEFKLNKNPQCQYCGQRSSA
jgi:adenylyltransferase/sulfurtransferase